MTFKEFMHTPNSHLDNLAREAEVQRTTNEEAIYDERISKAEQSLYELCYRGFVQKQSG